MIVVMKPRASENAVKQVIGVIESNGMLAHLSAGKEVTIIGVVGDKTKLDKRFLQAIPFLMEIEGSSPKKLEEEIRFLLSDKKRSGAPCVFTTEQILAIIDLACKSPCDFGYEVSQWSLPLLVTENEKPRGKPSSTCLGLSAFGSCSQTATCLSPRSARLRKRGIGICSISFSNQS